eukprot:355524-Chlamydomonas_euryale.AAC.8
MPPRRGRRQRGRPQTRGRPGQKARRTRQVQMLRPRWRQMHSASSCLACETCRSQKPHPEHQTRQARPRNLRGRPKRSQIQTASPNHLRNLQGQPAALARQSRHMPHHWLRIHAHPLHARSHSSRWEAMHVLTQVRAASG